MRALARAAPAAKSEAGRAQTAPARPVSNISAIRPSAAARFDFANIRIADNPPPLQRKIEIGDVNDLFEREADAVADRVIRMPDPTFSVSSAPSRVSRMCAACEEEQKNKLQAKPAGAEAGVGEAPPIVHDALREAGEPLDPATRAYFEPRFGRDLGRVRIHTGPKAAESATAVSALAYTVGSDVVFGAGSYAPQTARGRHLLAHEMAHVVQQGGAGQSRLQRFAASEVSKVAPTFQDMLTQIRQLIDAASSNGRLNWDFLVEISGGSSVGRKIDKTLGSNDPTIKSRLLVRYLFTCRCGLIDMRHFLQLLYISQFATGISQSEARGNRAATKEGREHELSAESESRFAPEDTPSNALGAATNLALPGLPGPDTVFDAIKDTLTRCDPVDWSSLAQASKDQIVKFYSDLVADPTPKKPGDKIPKNQNQTAVPDVLPINECGARERSLPFSLDTSDPDRKTLGGKNFLGGPSALSSASDIRDFVATQRPEIIRALPLTEKIRFIKKLYEWPVRAADKEAIEIIYKNSTADELRAEP